MTITLQQGFPPRNLTAEADARYIGRYNYSTHHGGWILILGAKRHEHTNLWTLRAAEEDFGAPMGPTVENVALDLWADRFADRPFDISKPTPDLKTWFEHVLAKCELFPMEIEFDMLLEAEFDMLLKAYQERITYCSSYDALRRIGITTPFDESPKIKRHKPITAADVFIK